MKLAALYMALAALSVTGCAADMLADKPADPPTASPPIPASMPDMSQTPDEAQTWQKVAAALGHNGVAQDHVYVVKIPRDDLKVAINGMGIPTAAGLESEFRFYFCPCGKLNVVGQFCVTDYESNDVAACLETSRFDVASTSPMFLFDNPRLMLLRFQSEGSPEDLGKTLQVALTWIGPERSKPSTQP